MATWNFSDVSTLVASSGFQVRRNARDVLHQNGVRKIIEADRFNLASKELAERDVDLLICDSEIGSGSSVELVRNLRHEITGHNPFVMVMSLVDPKQKEAVIGAVDAGSDDLVTKPFWGHELSERLWTLAKRNRKFSVSYDYIGPVRRREGARRDREAAEIAVPNPVKQIATGVPRDQLNAEIEAASMLLSGIKVRRDALFVARLIRGIVARLRAGETNGAISQRHDAVLSSLDDIQRRTAADDAAQTETRELLILALRKLTSGLPNPNPKIVEALLRLAQVVEMAFEEPDKPLDEEVWD